MQRFEKLETLILAAEAWTRLAGASMPGMHVAASDRNGVLQFVLSPKLNTMSEEMGKYAWNSFTVNDLRSFEELRDAVGPSMIQACMKLEELVAACHRSLDSGYSAAIDEINVAYLGLDQLDREAACEAELG